MSGIEQIVKEELQTIPDVITNLAQLEDFLKGQDDRRAVFVTAYRQITLEILKRIDNGFFLNGPWVSEYAVSFANLYRLALYHYERGETSLVPKFWGTSFRISSKKEGLVIQDLLLGINAHINHDLPISILAVSIEPNRSDKREDHNRVNQIIEDIIDRIQTRIADFYASGLGTLDRLLGHLDEDFTAFSLEEAREHAWVMGVSLVDSKDDAHREDLEKRIDTQADVLAHRILIPNRFPWLIEALRYLEQGPWWGGLMR